MYLCPVMHNTFQLTVPCAGSLAVANGHSFGLPPQEAPVMIAEKRNFSFLVAATGNSSGASLSISSAQNLHRLLASIPQDLLAQAAAQGVESCRRCWCFIRQHRAHQLSPACAPAACQHPPRSTGTGSSSMCCVLQALLVLHQDPPAQPSMCTSCLPASPKIYWHKQQRSVLCLAGVAGVSSGSIAPTSSAQHVHQLLASIPQDLLAQAAAQCAVGYRRSWCFIRTHQLSSGCASAACQHPPRPTGTGSSAVWGSCKGPAALRDPPQVQRGRRAEPSCPQEHLLL